MSERYEYEQEHGDKFHDYEEDSVEGQKGNWPEDSWNDYEDEDAHYLDDSLEEGEYDTREDLGWDGGLED